MTASFNWKRPGFIRAGIFILATTAALVAGCGGGDTDPVPALCEKLNSEDPEVRYAAVKSLEKLGTRATGAVGALAAALSDDDPKVRYRAAKTLAKIGPKIGDAVPALAKALKEDK